MSPATFLANSRVQGRVQLDSTRARWRHLTHGAQNGIARTAVVANSLPKAGTHLLLKALRLLPGLERIRLHISPDLQHVWPAQNGELTVSVGIASPTQISRAKLAQVLEKIPRGTFVTGHLPHNAEASTLFKDKGMKMVLLMRDPRDVVVSSARYLGGNPEHRLAAVMQHRGFDDRLLTSIVGCPSTRDSPPMLDIRTRVESALAWGDEPDCCMVRFEALVGEQGGGDRTRQVQELKKMTDHLELSVPDNWYEATADGLFGGTGTFRRGQIGSWGSHFSDEHVAAAKPLLDDLLMTLGYEEDSSWSRPRGQ